MKKLIYLTLTILVSACGMKKGLHQSFPCIPENQRGKLVKKESEGKTTFDFKFPANTNVDEIAKCFKETFKMGNGGGMMYGCEMYFKGGELKCRKTKSIFISIENRNP